MLITLREFNLRRPFYRVYDTQFDPFRVSATIFDLNTIPLDIKNIGAKPSLDYKTVICDSTDHSAFFDTQHAVFIMIWY